MWQTKCNADTLNADINIKIIIKFFIQHLKNATSSFKYKQLIYQFLLNKKNGKNINKKGQNWQLTPIGNLYSQQAMF